MNPEKLTREKGKRFYTMKPQLINKEGMLKLENYQWMLKLMCDFNTEENIPAPMPFEIGDHWFTSKNQRNERSVGMGSLPSMENEMKFCLMFYFILPISCPLHMN